MPTLHREAGYVFRFRANDRGEPPHVHVDGNDGRAKFWLAGHRLVRADGYTRGQLVQIEAIIGSHADDWTRKWHEFFE